MSTHSHTTQPTTSHDLKGFQAVFSEVLTDQDLRDSLIPFDLDALSRETASTISKHRMLATAYVLKHAEEMESEDRLACATDSDLDDVARAICEKVVNDRVDAAFSVQGVILTEFVTDYSRGLLTAMRDRLAADA